MSGHSIEDRKAFEALTVEVFVQAFKYSPKNFSGTRERLLHIAKGRKLSSIVKPIVMLAMDFIFENSKQKSRIQNYPNWVGFLNIHQYGAEDIRNTDSEKKWQIALVNAAILFIFLDSEKDLNLLCRLLTPIKMKEIEDVLEEQKACLSFKTRLNNWASKVHRGKKVPEYTVERQNLGGVCCRVSLCSFEGVLLSAKGGCCSNKKEAEESAAYCLWLQMEEDGLLFS